MGVGTTRTTWWRCRGASTSLALFVCACTLASACGDEARRPINASCQDDVDCTSGLCLEGVCLDPEGDEDGDGLTNVFEAVVETSAFLPDTDGDGLGDKDEVGDITNATDTDGDGLIDAVESTTADGDRDCIVDQLDADDGSVPSAIVSQIEALCRTAGVCAEADAGSIRLRCPRGIDEPQCVYDGVEGYEASESRCDQRDNDCDGLVDEDCPSRCDDGQQNGSESDVDCGGAVCDPCPDGSACELARDCVSRSCPGDSCVPPACDDAILNGDESDVDCGGACSACDVGDGCRADDDCMESVCSGDVCAAPTCGDGVRNGGESDVDCGGGCGPCAVGEGCDDAQDCVEGVCGGGVCAPAACDDGLTNGTESDVDCGGDCGPCAVGEGCDVWVDCVESICSDGVCAPATCDDSVRNGDETDADCGGSCVPCATGQGCDAGTDCAERVCGPGGICAAAACDDGVLNGGEEAIDCGGMSCMGCPCLGGGDCASGVCTGGICQLPTCDDAVFNGSETDVDCGGPDCGPCGEGGRCEVQADCDVGDCTAAGYCLVFEPLHVNDGNTCVVAEDGTGRVRCWGEGDRGKLGTATGTGHYGDDEVAASAPWIELGGPAVSVSIGSQSACAVFEDATARCWGWAAVAGIGANEVVGDDELPTSVPALALPSAWRVVQIATGSNGSCARLAGGTVTCWGSNNNGESGTSTSGNVGMSEVVEHDLGAPAVDIERGSGFSCALLNTGAVRCWGNNTYGKLGIGSTTHRGRTEPLANIPAVALAGPAIDISLGTDHACALLDSDGGVQCWGRASSYRLGYGHTDVVGDDETLDQVAPVLVGESLVQVAAGGSHSCVRDASGTVRCWGVTSQLATGATSTVQHASQSLPAVLGGSAVALGVGSTHNCVRLTTGELVCWGIGQRGELGGGSPAPIGDVDTLPPAAVLDICGPAASCPEGACDAGWCEGPRCDNGVIDGTEQDVDCGGPTCGGCGVGSTCREAADCVSGVCGAGVCSTTSCTDGFQGGDETDVDCGGSCSGCAHGRTCGGDNDCAAGVCSAGLCVAGSCLDGVENGTESDVDCGGSECRPCESGFTCGDDADCVGGCSNGFCRTRGRLAAGDFHVCAVRSGGGLRCWGRNTFGELGYGHVDTIGDTEPPSAAGDVSLEGSVMQVVAGRYFTCALIVTGEVQCWGLNTYGQLGLGHTDTIGDDELADAGGVLALPGQAVHLAAGREHACALLTTGAVACWGRGLSYQLGVTPAAHIGDDEPPALVPLPASAGRVVDVAAGADHTCIRTVDGELYCWGGGTSGKLGNLGNSAVQSADLATAVDLGPSPPVGMSLGQYQTCTTHRDGSVNCFGSNDRGALGRGHRYHVGRDNTPAEAGPLVVHGRATAVSTGRFAVHTTCVVVEPGAVRCWGQQHGGLFGNGEQGTIGDDEVAGASRLVLTPQPVTEVATGGAVTCAMAADGSVYCWGDGRHGVLGSQTSDVVGDEVGEPAFGPVPVD